MPAHPAEAPMFYRGMALGESSPTGALLASSILSPDMRDRLRLEWEKLRGGKWNGGTENQTSSNVSSKGTNKNTTGEGRRTRPEDIPSRRGRRRWVEVKTKIRLTRKRC